MERMVGQGTSSGERAPSATVQNRKPGQLFVKGLHQIVGQNGDAILAAFAGMNANCVTAEINIAHSKPQALQYAQSRTVHQTGGQTHVGCNVRQQVQSLRAAEHHRQAALRFGAHHIIQPGKLNIEHLSIHEQQGLQSASPNPRMIFRLTGCIAVPEWPREHGPASAADYSFA